MQVNLNLSDHSLEFRKELAFLSEDPKLLSVLAKDEEEEVRQAVAENTNTSKKTLNDLAFNRESTLEIIIAVAENENTGIDTLKRLAKHENPEIRQYVASNKNLNLEIITILANDSDFEVILLIASHSSTPIEILEKFLETFNDSLMFEALADNPNTSSEMLDTLFDESYCKFNRNSIAQFIAKNNNATAELLEDIVEELPELAELVLMHPNLSMKIINKLMTSKDYDVRDAARRAKKRKRAEMNQKN